MRSSAVLSSLLFCICDERERERERERQRERDRERPVGTAADGTPARQAGFDSPDRASACWPSELYTRGSTGRGCEGFIALRRGWERAFNVLHTFLLRAAGMVMHQTLPKPITGDHSQ